MQVKGTEWKFGLSFKGKEKKKKKEKSAKNKEYIWLRKKGFFKTFAK